MSKVSTTTIAVAAADVAVVAAFVLIGRSSHHAQFDLAASAVTAWPFLAGLLTAWGVVVLAKRPLQTFLAGGIVTAVTVAVGSTLRHVATINSAPLTFVMVATAFMTVAFLAVRGVAALVLQRRRE